MPRKKKNRPPLSEESILALIGLAKQLKQIHVRLVMEGYTITDGAITPPAHMQEIEKKRGRPKK